MLFSRESGNLCSLSTFLLTRFKDTWWTAGKCQETESPAQLEKQGLHKWHYGTYLLDCNFYKGKVPGCFAHDCLILAQNSSCHLVSPQKCLTECSLQQHIY